MALRGRKRRGLFAEQPERSAPRKGQNKLPQAKCSIWPAAAAFPALLGGRKACALPGGGILVTQQTVNLVLDTIRLAMKQQKKAVAAELQLHSGQGFQYTSQAYFNLTQAYGSITPSMSRKGNPYDNAMAENFFSILKTECIYRHKPATFSEANEMIDRYIHFYNHERIQLKTGEAPLARRLSY